MAIPSGAGTEVLKRETLATGNGWREILSGSSDHIYTVISLIFTSETSTTGGVGIRMNNGAADIAIVTWDGNMVNGYDTFVWNDKFVLEEDDDLDCYNAQNGCWYLSYIDQHF